MKGKRLEWLERMSREVRLNDAGVIITAHSSKWFLDHPDDLPVENIQWTEIEDFRIELPRTFLVRIFSIYEGCLRDCWPTLRGKRTVPKTENLINGVASRCKIPSDIIDECHKIRQLRNDVVHQAKCAEIWLDPRKLKTDLCLFLSRLPPDWES